MIEAESANEILNRIIEFLNKLLGMIKKFETSTYKKGSSTWEWNKEIIEGRIKATYIEVVEKLKDLEENSQLEKAKLTKDFWSDLKVFLEELSSIIDARGGLPSIDESVMSDKLKQLKAKIILKQAEINLKINDLAVKKNVLQAVPNNVEMGMSS